MNLNDLKDKLNNYTKCLIIINLIEHDLTSVKESLALFNDDSLEFSQNLFYLYNQHCDINEFNMTRHQEFSQLLKEIIERQIVLQTRKAVENAPSDLNGQSKALISILDIFMSSRQKKEFHKNFKIVHQLETMEEKSLFLSALVHYFYPDSNIFQLLNDGSDITLGVKEKNELKNIFNHLETNAQIKLLTQTDLSKELLLDIEFFNNIEKESHKDIIKDNIGGYKLYLLEAILALGKDNSHLIEAIFKSSSKKEIDYTIKNFGFFTNGIENINQKNIDEFLKYYPINLLECINNVSSDTSQLILECDNNKTNSDNFYYFLKTLAQTNKKKKSFGFLDNEESFMVHFDFQIGLNLYEEDNIDKLYHFLRLTYLQKHHDQSELALLTKLQDDLSQEHNKNDCIGSFDFDCAKIEYSKAHDNIEEKCYHGALVKIEKRIIQLKLDLSLDDVSPKKTTKKVKL